MFVCYLFSLFCLFIYLFIYLSSYLFVFVCLFCFRFRLFLFFLKDVISLSKKSQDAKPLEFNPMSLEDIIRKMAPLLKGKDGRDGKDGKDGRDGRDGLRVRNLLLLLFLALYNVFTLPHS